MYRPVFCALFAASLAAGTLLVAPAATATGFGTPKMRNIITGAMY
jgi:hypothetical protein